MRKAVNTMLAVLLNVFFYGMVVFGGVELCRNGYSFAYEILGECAMETPPGQDKIFMVAASQDDFDIAENLASQGLVNNKYSFYLRMQLRKEENRSLKTGVYTLNTSMSYDDILHIIRE